MENREANKVDYTRTTLKQDTYMTKLYKKKTVKISKKIS